MIQLNLKNFSGRNYQIIPETTDREFSLVKQVRKKGKWQTESILSTNYNAENLEEKRIHLLHLARDTWGIDLMDLSNIDIEEEIVA